MLVLHHMHCSYSNTCTALTSSQALLFHHMHCYHCFTCTVPPAGIELTITDLGFFSSTQKEKEKRHTRGNRTHDHWPWFFLTQKEKEKKRPPTTTVTKVTAYDKAYLHNPIPHLTTPAFVKNSSVNGRQVLALARHKWPSSHHPPSPPPLANPTTYTQLKMP